MVLRSILLALFVLAGAVTPQAAAAEMALETFENDPASRWQFFTDGVMGGVSSGELTFEEAAGSVHARMTGEVSTANNGGFIQMRTDALGAPRVEATGVRLVMRGSNGPYYVHVRTSNTRLPWQFYQAGFNVTPAWSEVRLPFDAFKARGGLLRAGLKPQSIASVAIAAYGRDHGVEIEIREIGFY